MWSSQRWRQTIIDWCIVRDLHSLRSHCAKCQASPCKHFFHHGVSRFPKACAAGFLLRGFLHQSSVTRTCGHCEQRLWIEAGRRAPDHGSWLWYSTIAHILYICSWSFIYTISQCQYSQGEQALRSQHGVDKVWWCRKGVEISAILIMEKYFDSSFFSLTLVFQNSVRLSVCTRLQGGHLPWLLPTGLGRLRHREQLEPSPGLTAQLP